MTMTAVPRARELVHYDLLAGIRGEIARGTVSNNKKRKVV